MKLGKGIFGLLTLAVTLGPDAMGNSLRFDFNAAGSSTPLVTAIFADAGVDGVKLTLTAPGLEANNSVQRLFFNLNPAFDPADLTITPTGANGGVLNTPHAQANGIKTGGGGGKYDLRLEFGNSPAFTTGDTLTFYINRAGGLTAGDFDFLNTKWAGGPEEFAAVKIQLSVDQTEFVPGDPVVTPNAKAVPDMASTAGLLCLGLGTLALLGNRRLITAPRAAFAA
jgi:hypothetical protein